MFIRLFIGFSLFQVCIFTSNLNAQSEVIKQEVFCDYDLDYFPRFKSIRKPEDKHGGGIVTDEFTIVLKQIFNSCNYKVDNISLFSGWTMQSTGLYPEPLKNTAWATLQLDEKGDVEMLNFENIKLKDELINCIRQTIDGSRVYPALRYNVPVKCRLYLMIE